MIVFVGASASGKTELAKMLYKVYGYNKCITTTTRLMRSNEQQDIDYHFISKDTFLDLQLKGEFVEVTEYQDHLYGIQKKDVNINGIVIVDPNGANTLIDQLKENIFVVYVESSKELRKSRMIKRGDDEPLIEKRLLLDDHVFKSNRIKKINLYLKNEEKSLKELATYIHHHYQLYLETRCSRTIG